MRLSLSVEVPYSVFAFSSTDYGKRKKQMFEPYTGSLDDSFKKVLHRKFKKLKVQERYLENFIKELM